MTRQKSRLSHCPILLGAGTMGQGQPETSEMSGTRGTRGTSGTKQAQAENSIQEHTNPGEWPESLAAPLALLRLSFEGFGRALAPADAERIAALLRDLIERLEQRRVGNDD